MRKFASGMQQELDAQLDHQKRKHPISLMGTYCLSLFLGFLPACCYYNCGETSIHFAELVLLLLKENVKGNTHFEFPLMRVFSEKSLSRGRIFQSVQECWKKDMMKKYRKKFWNFIAMVLV